MLLQVLVIKGGGLTFQTEYDMSVHLSYGDMCVDIIPALRYFEVRIKASKTDPFHQGVMIYLGVAGEALHPVAATLRYMVMHGGAPGPFFIYALGKFLTHKRFVSAVRSA